MPNQATHKTNNKTHTQTQRNQTPLVTLQKQPMVKHQITTRSPKTRHTTTNTDTKKQKTKKQQHRQERDRQRDEERVINDNIFVIARSVLQCNKFLYVFVCYFLCYHMGCYVASMYWKNMIWYGMECKLSRHRDCICITLLGLPPTPSPVLRYTDPSEKSKSKNNSPPTPPENSKSKHNCRNGELGLDVSPDWSNTCISCRSFLRPQDVPHKYPLSSAEKRVTQVPTRVKIPRNIKSVTSTFRQDTESTCGGMSCFIYAQSESSNLSSHLSCLFS